MYTYATKISLSVSLALCLLFFSGHSHAQLFERNGNTVTYRGNNFEYPQKGIADTQIVVDPVTGKEVIKITVKDPIPTKMNGVRIYNTDEITQKPTPVEEGSTLERYIVRGVSAELNKLPSGVYYLYVSNVVVDAKGKIVYYEYDGLTSERNRTKVPADIKSAVEKKIDPLMNAAPAFKPGRINGKAVIVRTDIMLSLFKIVVKNHKATLVRGF